MTVEATPQTNVQRRRKMLSAATIIGAVSVATALGILAVLHLMRYFPAATGIIVGLHLLPLAGPFRQQIFRVFAYLLVAWSAGCLLLETHVALFSTIGEAALVAALVATLLYRRKRLAILSGTRSRA